MMEYKAIPLQLKALKARELEGYGSIFGNVDKGGDVVHRGAFADSLAELKASDTLAQMFWMHDWAQVPGRWDEMAEDTEGLYVKGTLAKTQLGDEMRELTSMKAVRGLSIGYFPDFDATEYDDDGVRHLHKVELIEVSLVSLAMNPLAQISAFKARLSAAGEYVPTARQFERSLRDVGLSQSCAKRLVSAAFGDAPRDVASGTEDEGIAEIIEMAGKIATESEIAVIKSLTESIL